MAFIFLGELFFLFLLSRTLTRELSFLFYRITRSKKWAIRLLAALFLPGTMVHEFSHAAIAEVMFVRARHMTLLPEFDGETVKLGSVQVEKTDFIRSFFIGLAPFFVGTILIVGSIWFVSSNIIPQTLLTFIILGYLIFTVSNTMFSSKNDLKGALEFIVLSSIITVTLYLLGIRIDLTSDLQNKINELFKQASIFLAIPLGIDILIIIFSRLLNRRI